MRFILFLIMIITTLPSNGNAQNNKKLKIIISNTTFTATLNDNETVDAFVNLLPMTVDMTEMGGYEKYHNLSNNLPGVASNPGTTHEGDLMIWSSNCLVLFYTTRSTSYSYIQLGRIDNTSGLREAVGRGNVQVTFELEGDPTGNESIEIDKKLFDVRLHTGYLEVGGETDRLTLYSLTGKIAGNSNTNTISTAGINRGIYLLEIGAKNQERVTKKIIIN